MMTRQDIVVLYEQGVDDVVELVQALFAHMEQQRAQIAAQQEQITTLTERVKELEDRLSKNSRNSDKPPSSDFPLSPRPKSLRPKKSTKKPGGQPGHPGATLSWVEEPDRILRHSPEECEHCGTSLLGIEALGRERRRQVVDLPKLLALEVSEQRAERKCCPECGQESSAAFPEGVGETVGYGPRIKALLVYLNQYQLLPYERSAELLADVFGGATPSAGTLYTAVQKCYEGLEEAQQAIKQSIKRADVAHFDETGLRVEGEGWWLHVASTPTLTHYAVHPKRGSEATDEIGILANFAGSIGVHDGWSSYRNYEGFEHALCNAHHLRELIFVEERLEQEWAGQMSKLLVEIRESVEQARRAAGGARRLDSRSIKRYERRYQKIIEEGHRANPPPEPTGKPGRPKRGKAGSLLDRLDKRREEVLRFMHDFRVPFDNNQAERDLRMCKVQQKIAGCFRRREGAEKFCRIRSYISTVRKRGEQVLPALERVFRGDAFVPSLLAE